MNPVENLENHYNKVIKFQSLIKDNSKYPKLGKAEMSA